MNINYPGIIDYNLVVKDKFPKTTEELEDYLREVAQSYVGRMIQNPDHFRKEVEAKINNILKLALQRDLIDEPLFCWCDMPEVGPDMFMELRDYPRSNPEMDKLLKDSILEELRVEEPLYPSPVPGDDEKWTQAELQEFELLYGDEDD